VRTLRQRNFAPFKIKGLIGRDRRGLLDPAVAQAQPPSLKRGRAKSQTPELAPSSAMRLQCRGDGPAACLSGEHQRGRPGRRQWLRQECRPDLAMPAGMVLFQRSAVVASSGVTG
jgi:hypothetical protein